MTLDQLKIGESQASCEALQMAFSWGLYPLFCLFMTNKGSWLSPAKSFSLPSFQIYIIHLLFLQKGCSAAHESVFFNHPSVQEITQLQFPFPAIWNWKERQRQQHASKGTVGAPECLSNISIYLLCKSYKKACYMKHLPSHSPF